ncbi:MAG: glutamate racemase [Gemmatimonadaceae bacterium]|nr:glutamate racemase [Chitinophagaceae bacterium]
MEGKQPIGIFDSGYGGLTVMREITNRMPEYDYLYLGDNARAPYGPRSFDTVYRYTLEAVQWFFDRNCSLVILACNTASAKALRTIQQNDLPRIAPEKRVLGVIRPTTEVIGNFSPSGNIGILGTSGTVNSGSYPIEIEKFFPTAKVFQQACPMWVPLIENNEFNSNGADFFVRKSIHELLLKSAMIDTILLACTHYPLMLGKIKEYSPADMTIITQGEIVARSLDDYLERHPAMKSRCSAGGIREFFTTDSTEDFDNHATTFFGEPVRSRHTVLGQPQEG